MNDREDMALHPSPIAATEGGLLPCPFCGGEPSDSGTVRYSSNHEAWFADGSQVLEAFYINCVRCGCSNMGMIGHQTKDKAVAHWNTRTPAPSLGEDVVKRVARAIGATSCKLGGPLGARVYDVDLTNAAHAALSSMRPVQGVGE